jgi:AcrR family transcriptional regulator
MTDVYDLDALAPHRPGRPRSEQAERAIIEASLDLLVEEGFDGMSMEQVAARAGVGKTTIYRRWANKEALIVDAAASLRLPLPELPGRSIREDLRILADVLVAEKQAERSRELYTCFLAEGRRHPELAQKFNDLVLEPRREYVRNVLRGAVARGELRDDMDIDTMVVAVTGPFLYLSMVASHYRFAEGRLEGMTDRLVDTLLDGLRPR